MPKILIVEDDEKLREQLKIFLNNNGYETDYLNSFKNIIRGYIKNKSQFTFIRY